MSSAEDSIRHAARTQSDTQPGRCADRCVCSRSSSEASMTRHLRRVSACLQYQASTLRQSPDTVFEVLFAADAPSGLNSRCKNSNYRGLQSPSSHWPTLVQLLLPRLSAGKICRPQLHQVCEFAKRRVCVYESAQACARAVEASCSNIMQSRHGPRVVCLAA